MDRMYVCARGHSYDVARSGYVNLLQPQDRRSQAAGDSAAAVEARARLHAAGVGGALITALREHLRSVPLPDDSVIADLGSGSGDALATCAGERAVGGIGIDLSTAAANHAARRFPQLAWVVANADRRLPLLDHRVSVLLSLHGRRNAAESARVLTATGLLVVAVPAPDDLLELRTLLHGKGLERSRVDALVAEHESHFAPIARFSTNERPTLNHDALVDLLHTTYRGARTSANRRVATLSTMEVTLSSDCVLFRPKQKPT